MNICNIHCDRSTNAPHDCPEATNIKSTQTTPHRSQNQSQSMLHYHLPNYTELYLLSTASISKNTSLTLTHTLYIPIYIYNIVLFIQCALLVV